MAMTEKKFSIYDDYPLDHVCNLEEAFNPRSVLIYDYAPETGPGELYFRVYLKAAGYTVNTWSKPTPSRHFPAHRDGVVVRKVLCPLRYDADARYAAMIQAVENKTPSMHETSIPLIKVGLKIVLADSFFRLR